MEITDSDGDYSEDDTQSEDDSAYGSASDTEENEGERDEGGWAFSNDYGDLEETGGRYAVLMEDGREVSLEEHENICGCDLDAEDSPHRKIAAAVHDRDDVDTATARTLTTAASRILISRTLGFTTSLLLGCWNSVHIHRCRLRVEQN